MYWDNRISEDSDTNNEQNLVTLPNENEFFIVPAGWFVFYPGNCSFESESSPTSAHACGEVTGCVLAAKKSACVAPEVDLGECTLHSPLQKVNKAEPTLALNPRWDITSNPKQEYQWPQKGLVSAKNFKKRKGNHSFILLFSSQIYCILCWCWESAGKCGFLNSA